MNFLKDIISRVLGAFGAFLAGFAYSKMREEKKELKEDAENARREAQKWADARNISTPERLRKLARKSRS